MAVSTIIAASGFEPIQNLLNGIAGIFIFLTVLTVAGSGLIILIRIIPRVGIPTLRTYPTLRTSLPENLPPAARPVAPLSASGREIPLATRLRSIDWFQFEKLTEIVYRRQGFLVDRRGGANPDGGVDLVLIRNAEKTAVQCKHWKNRDIGVPTIRELVGAMQDAGIAKGVLVTISRCTREAQACAARNRIEILDHANLEKLLETLGARHDPEIQQLLSDRRKFCPKCENLMVLRQTKNGQNAGRQFWGCSTYPACKRTENC